MPKIDAEPGSPRWFSLRLGRLTASLAAACLRRNPHMGPLAAYRQIMGITHRQANEHVLHGMKNEDRARQEFYRLGLRSGWFKEIAPEAFYIHDEYPWLGATPDGEPDDDSVLDIKCPSVHFPEELPEYHEVQLRVQMACANRSKAHYFAWREVGSHFHRCIERDLSIEAALIRDLCAFYETHVLTGIPPARRAAKRVKENA